MSDTNVKYEHIPASEFEFARHGEEIHDEKLETKSRGYFADAFLRFSKNKSSVVAAIIIGLQILFAIVSPLISPYKVTDKEKRYTNYPPFVRWIADMNIGILDGSTTHASQNEAQYAAWKAIGIETGMDPVLKIVSTHETMVVRRGKEVPSYSYKLKTNKYYETGVVYRVLSYEEFEAIQQFQNETGIQVIYPYVETKDIEGITDNPNIWYEVSDSKGTPKLDKDGNYTPVYSKNSAIEGAPYNSLRIPGDDGSYIYSIRKSGSVQARVCYYNYYRFVNGKEPTYIFGTNSMGQDIFCAIGVGARFSLVFAVIVSAINLTIGGFLRRDTGLLRRRY